MTEPQIDYQTGEISLHLNNPLAKILISTVENFHVMNFIDRKISPAKAVQLLVKKGIGIKESEATVLLDFLYLLAKNYHREDDDMKNLDNPEEISNTKK